MGCSTKQRKGLVETLERFKCGKTYHMNVPSANALIENVMRQSKFDVDSGSTVLYGVCENCRKN